MPETSDRFAAAMAAIDAANAADPNQETVDGGTRPAAILYSERMSAWLDRLDPNASEPLKLAARAQHIERWTIPRDSYPMDRPGYLKWRTDLGKFHADRAGAIMADAGYDDEAVERTKALIRKRRLKKDPETQRLEDVICLVFLENYFADFSKQHDEAKIVSILQKTWKKMSPDGHAAALDLVGKLPDDARAIVEKALKDA